MGKNKGVVRFEVMAEDAGGRMDRFLAEKLSADFSRAHLQKLVGAGCVSIDGQAVKNNYRLKEGEYVELVVPEPKASGIRPERIKLDIVYEDGSVIMVNKSADMVVHPAPGNYTGTLANALMAHCKNLSGISGELKPGIVHRIDKGTSGLIIAAKTDAAHRSLAKQFKDKTIKREYIAVVKGVMQLDNGIIELPIGRSPRNRQKMAVSFDNSKEAATRYRVLKRFSSATLVELTLMTGRTHQIRVHMSYIGHPLLGDLKYGGCGSMGRPALHAKTLGFVHPKTKKRVEFTSELPEDMRELIEKCGKGKER